MRFRISVLILMVVAVTVSGLSAQDHENVEQVGRIYYHWDSAEDVVVVGDLAYVADGLSGLQIVDISDLENLQIVSSWRDNQVRAKGVTVSGGYAYVADGSSGLRVISVADPEHPEEVGYYDTPGYAYGVTVSGDYAYIVDTEKITFRL